MRNHVCLESESQGKAKVDSRLTFLTRFSIPLAFDDERLMGMLIVAWFPLWWALMPLQGAPHQTKNVVAVVDLVVGKGAEENRKEFLFEDIRGLLIAQNGNILIADSRNDAVSGFSADGNYLWTIGRTGSGPGDLRSPCCIAVNQRRLWVQESGNYRYSTFSLEDSPPQFGWTIRMPSQSISEANPVAITSDHLVIHEGREIDATSALTTATLKFVDSAGRVIRQIKLPNPPDDSLTAFSFHNNRGSTTFEQPFGPRKLRAVGPNGVMAEAISSKYSITVFDPSRGQRYLIERSDLQGPHLSPSERASAERTVGSIKQRTNGGFPYGVPDRKPVIGALGFDPLGRLVVELSVVQGNSNEADVYDTSGKLSFHLLWPNNVQLRYWALYRDFALGVQIDSLGTQQVVRMRLR